MLVTMMLVLLMMMLLMLLLMLLLMVLLVFELVLPLWNEGCLLPIGWTQGFTQRFLGRGPSESGGRGGPGLGHLLPGDDEGGGLHDVHARGLVGVHNAHRFLRVRDYGIRLKKTCFRVTPLNGLVK